MESGLEPLIVDLIPHSIEITVARRIPEVGKINQDPVCPNPFAVDVRGGLQPPVGLPGTEERGRAIGFSDLLAERCECAVAGPTPAEPVREDLGPVTYAWFGGMPESINEFASIIAFGIGHGAYTLPIGAA